MHAVTYARVSTDEQGDSGLGLEAQEATLRTEVERRGWSVSESYVDVASGKSMKRRPRLAAALDVLAAGDADVLVVAKLDRLSRSVADFASMLARATEAGWGINVCDLGVDTTTPNGKMVAQIMMVLAEWEREMIGVRTKSALAAARARGTKVGRRSGVTDQTVMAMRMLRDNGAGYHAIAKALNAEGVPTAQGGAEWYAGTVRTVLMRRDVSVSASAPRSTSRT